MFWVNEGCVKKQITWAAVVLSVAALGPVHSHQCEEVRDAVMSPLKNVAGYLAQAHDLDSLSGPGCQYVLGQLKQLPSGSDLIRQVATQRVENTERRCLFSVNSIEYDFEQPAIGQDPRFTPQSYSYCGQWEFSMTNQPSYELAIELSLKLDTAYEKAQRMCGLAIHMDARAVQAAHELASYLEGEVAEPSEKTFQTACGG